MNTRERHRTLLETLKRDKRVYVKELAEKFDVTTMTIRRDLRGLAARRIVTLVHGGAIYNEGTATIASVGVRAQVMQVAKQKLGAYCAGLVQEGNAIFLDAGSTAMSIAEALVNRKNIAVLTNSLAVLNILAHSDGLQLFTMAGIYQCETHAFFGDLACRTIRGFRIDLAFLGTSGITLEAGLMSPTEYDCAIKKTLMEVARRRVAVADHTKIGHESFLRVAPVKDLSLIVTDKEADENFVTGARRQGVEVVQV